MAMQEPASIEQIAHGFVANIITVLFVPIFSFTFLQDVQFIMSLFVVTEALSHRKPTFARNMEHFDTVLRQS